MGFKEATTGTVFCLAATIVLALVSFNTPLLKSLNFLTATYSDGTATFGTLGYCLTDSGGTTTCTGPKLGYEFNPNTIFGITQFSIPTVITKYLTYVLVLHIVALVAAAGATVLGALSHIGTLALMCFPTCFAYIASAFSLLAFILDLVIWFIAKARINSVSGASASIGACVWMTLAAWLLLGLSGCALGCGRCCVGRSREARDREKRRNRDEYQGVGSDQGHYGNGLSGGKRMGPPIRETEVSVPLTATPVPEEDKYLREEEDEDQHGQPYGVGDSRTNLTGGVGGGGGGGGLRRDPSNVSGVGYGHGHGNGRGAAAGMAGAGMGMGMGMGAMSSGVAGQGASPSNVGGYNPYGYQNQNQNQGGYGGQQQATDPYAPYSPAGASGISGSHSMDNMGGGVGGYGQQAGQAYNQAMSPTGTGRSGAVLGAAGYVPGGMGQGQGQGQDAWGQQRNDQGMGMGGYNAGQMRSPGGLAEPYQDPYGAQPQQQQQARYSYGESSDNSHTGGYQQTYPPAPAGAILPEPTPTPAGPRSPPGGGGGGYNPYASSRSPPIPTTIPQPQPLTNPYGSYSNPTSPVGSPTRQSWSANQTNVPVVDPYAGYDSNPNPNPNSTPVVAPIPRNIPNTGAMEHLNAGTTNTNSNTNTGYGGQNQHSLDVDGHDDSELDLGGPRPPSYDAGGYGAGPSHGGSASQQQQGGHNAWSSSANDKSGRPL